MAYVPLIPPDAFLPIALIFSILALFSAGWLIFFVEKSVKEISRKDLVIGLIVRLLAFSITAGIAAQFWVLIEII
ncbi:MAG: hypothetical protein ACXAEU_02605 [Candidatus Hodarchaeales archaeon]|jgi:hypothetical protein